MDLFGIIIAKLTINLNKKMRRLITLVIVLISTLCVVNAQDEMKVSEQMARDILSQMSNTVKSYKAFRMTFSMTNENKRTGSKEKTTGVLIVKGDKYVIDLPDFVTYNDTKTVSVWQRKNNEVDISDADPDAEGDLSPSKLFCAYQSGYKLRLLGDRKIGSKTCTEIDLYPTDKKTNIIRIRLSVDASTNAIQRIFQQMKSGDSTTIDIEKFETNVSLSDNDFVFDVVSHKDVEVVDLR